MNGNSFLLVCGAIVIGGLGGYATTLNKSATDSLQAANNAVAESKPAAPEGSPTTTGIEPPAQAVAGAPGTVAPGTGPKVATAAPVKVASSQSPAKKKPTKKTASKSKQKEDAEAKRVAAACSAFISAAKAGNPGSIIATVTKSQHEPIRARTKWVSGAGMEMYREFGNNVVKVLSTKITGDKAEVRLANKTDVEGTDSMYRKSRKYNRRAAYINLVKENGTWKVSGFGEDFQVWNE